MKGLPLAIAVIGAMAAGVVIGLLIGNISVGVALGAALWGILIALGTHKPPAQRGRRS